MTSAVHQFLEKTRGALAAETLQKLTLGKYRGAEAGLENVFVRPVDLKAGPRLAFVWRYATRDVTKNLEIEKAPVEIERLLADGFRDAHLFTRDETVQLATDDNGSARLRTMKSGSAERERGHDHEKARLVPATTPWLVDLGVTNEQGRPREAQADKFRQINKFAELLQGLVAEVFGPTDPLTVADMGCGKGYLTFALAEVLGARAMIRGIEARAELVDLTNQVSRKHGLDSRLVFEKGTIEGTRLAAVDILVALHACDTATDDALAKGIAAGARLLVVAPCCQKELRPQLKAPDVLAGALRHGIFQERQAEFVTDALRAELLEWAGYRAKVFEFISTEHTAKNLMIVGVRSRADHDRAAETRAKALAEFFGVKRQRLAELLGFEL